MIHMTYFSTIRLILGIFKVVGVHGWTLVGSIQAGGSKVGQTISFYS